MSYEYIVGYCYGVTSESDHWITDCEHFYWVEHSACSISKKWKNVYFVAMTKVKCSKDS